MASADVKKRASRLLRQYGTADLAPLGASRNASGRVWTIDNGWWLIHVEFQGSHRAVGAYVNVSPQFLWIPSEHPRYDYSPRKFLPDGSQFVDLERADDTEAERRVALLSATAREAVLDWRDRGADRVALLEWVASQDTRDPWDAFRAAFALAELGRSGEASAMFETVPTSLDPAIAWQAELTEDSLSLAVLARQPEAFRHEVARRIALSRSLLHLAPWSPSPDLGGR